MALGFSRLIGQSFWLHGLDGPIEVKLTKLKGTRVNVAVSAPKSVVIRRDDMKRDHGGYSNERVRKSEEKRRLHVA